MAAALAAAASIAGALVVVAVDRVPAELGGGDREHAGAGAEVGQRAARPRRPPPARAELEAEAGGRVGAGAEGAAGVDDEVDRALARLLPGGAQPEPLADQQRLVEVLPAVGPVVGDLGRADLDQALARRGLDLAQLRQLPLAAVDRVLDVARARAPPRPRSGASTVSSASTSSACSGAQRTASRINPKARRTREKKLSLAARRSAGSAARATRSSFSASSRCSSERFGRDDHVDDDHAGRRAGRRRSRAGRGRAARTGCRAGCRRAARSRARPRGWGP